MVVVAVDRRESQEEEKVDDGGGVNEWVNEGVVGGEADGTGNMATEYLAWLCVSERCRYICMYSRQCGCGCGCVVR